MTKQYGMHDLVVEPTERQRIFGSVKDKAAKCMDRTQLCAVIYPWIRDLVYEYRHSPASQRYMDSFRGELYYFKRGLSIFLSGIPFCVDPGSEPLDLERIRDGALDAAISMAVDIANLEVNQISVNLSAIMARFVEAL